MTPRSRLRSAAFVSVTMMLLAAAAARRIPARSAPSTPAARQDRQLFVDPTLSVESCESYAPDARACTSGSAPAFRSLAAAARAATAGTTVVIREGTYRETIAPTASGSADAPITFRRYEKETVLLTGPLDPAIDLTDREHIIIDGLTIRDVVGWLRAVKTSRSVVRNSVFSEASATDARAGLTFIGATDNQIRDNLIAGGQDNILLIDSSRNVVHGNTVTKGRHALWAVLCGSRNIIRRNRLVNEWGQIGEVGGCHGVPEAPSKQSAAERNVIEENLFYSKPGARTPAPYAGLEYAAQEAVIRNNIVIGTSGPGLQMTLGSERARSSQGNRIYHNVFVATGLAGIELPADGDGVFEDNLFKNNILYGSRVSAGTGIAAKLAGKAVQILAGRLTGFVMDRNVIYGMAPREQHAIVVMRAGSPDPRPLSAWEKASPQVFRDNIDIRPVFRDERELDFSLADESALVDSGAFLTRTTRAGAGTSLPVEDVRWFSDGLGIAGERGDEIQLRGATRTARVIGVAKDSQTLTLDASLTWEQGQGVALRYSGTAPRLGLSEGVTRSARSGAQNQE